MSLVTVRAEANVLNMTQGSVHTIERTDLISNHIRQGYLTAVPRSEDTDGLETPVDLPAKDAKKPAWEQFAADVGVTYPNGSTLADIQRTINDARPDLGLGVYLDLQ